MAGTCVGAGLDIDGDGQLELRGARSLAWPYPCDIGVRNGLRVDPVTNKAWVKPPQIVGHSAVSGPDRSIAPASAADIAIGHYEVTHTASACSQEFVRYAVTGGFAGFRLKSGNFWILQRYVSLFVNGSPVATTGLQPIAECENNSGGVTTQGAVLEGTESDLVVNAGDVVKLVADYTLQLPGFDADVLNNFVYRAPRVSLTAWPTE